MNNRSSSSWMTPVDFLLEFQSSWAPPTINRVVQTMKESEMHDAPTEWQAVRVAFEWMQGFQFRQASLAERLKFPTNTAEDPLDLGEKVLLTDKCMIPGFQSVVAHGRTQSTMMMGHQLNVMMQVPYADDKADLPNGLYVMRTYTELKDGSRSVSVMLRNLTAMAHSSGQRAGHGPSGSRQCCPRGSMFARSS